MTSADFEELKDYILTRNTYFAKGFANAFKDDLTSGLYCREASGDMICIMPNDTLGDYFYLRNEGDIKFAPRDIERVSDNGPQRLAFLDTLNVQLIAMVRKADEFDLINNIRNTVMAYTKMPVIPIAANCNREQVVVNEMRGMAEEDIAACLQRLDNNTVIRVTLQVNKRFIAENCITDVCKSC